MDTLQEPNWRADALNFAGLLHSLAASGNLKVPPLFMALGAVVFAEDVRLDLNIEVDDFSSLLHVLAPLRQLGDFEIDKIAAASQAEPIHLWRNGSWTGEADADPTLAWLSFNEPASEREVANAILHALEREANHE